MTDPDLERFVNAQGQVRAQVTAELKAGRKTTHWMWFVFPQLDGLARSDTARRFGISDVDQARRYLADEFLGPQLRADVRAMLTYKGTSARQILGSPDDMKFRSCLTLFLAAAKSPADQQLFQNGLDQFYDSEPDQQTLALLLGRHG